MTRLPHTAKCSSGVDDTIAVDQDYDGEVVLIASHVPGYGTGTPAEFTVYLSPADARRLAKAIKKAAKRAEAAQ